MEIKTVTSAQVAVTSLSVSPATLNLVIGKTSQITRTVTPSDATSQTVTWTSSDNNVALVNNDGWVSAVSIGSATITASLSGFTAQTTVNVTAPPTSYSTRLTGTANERYGLAKSLRVMPGDVITMEVYAKYLDTNTNNWTAALTNLMTAIAAGTAPAGTFVDGGAAGSIGGTTFPYAGVLPRTGDTGAGPKAYLNYIVFDKNFVYKTGGFKRLSDNPKEDGTDVPHERLAFDGAQQITITEPGYIYIYLSNENDTPVEVYFDDFKVDHIKGPIVSSQDYYPFGLSFNLYSRENSVPQDFKFNGKEEQNELNIGWLDFGARMYQPELGRFFTQDRFSEKYFDYSPYHFAGNNPLKYVDVNGDSAYTAIKSNAEVLANDLNTIYKNKYGEDAADAFTVTTGSIDVTKTVEQDVEFDLFNPDTWDGKTEVTMTEKQEVYFVTTNADSKFDWNTDKYSQATFDVLNKNRNIEVLVQAGDTRVGGHPLYTTLQQAKGHAYKEYQKIALWSGLNRALKGGWSFGGTFLHEAIGHFHHLGDQEPANPLQNHFGLPKSSLNHNGTPRMRWNLGERNRLNNLRKKK